MNTRWHLRTLRSRFRGPLVEWRHRELRDNDVIIAEYPRSGSTWLSSLLRDYLSHGRDDVPDLAIAIPAVGGQARAATLLPGGGRMLRSHEPHRPDYRRCIYLVRHVADVAVSYYHWMKWIGWLPDERVSVHDFLAEMFTGVVDGYGPWPEHVDAWLEATPPQTLVVRYEDLRGDPFGTMINVLGFLGVDLAREDLARVIETNVARELRTKDQSLERRVPSRIDARRQLVRAATVGDALNWLDDDDFKTIDRFAGAQLARLGYELKPSPSET